GCLNHDGRAAGTIRAPPGSGGATTGCDKHGDEDAKSDQARAFQKHCISSLNVSTRRRLKAGWKRCFALIQPKRTYRNKSFFADERSHQKAPLKLTFAARYTLFVVH